LEIIGRFVCAATEREFLTNAITAMLSPDLPSQQQAPLLVYRAAMQAQQGKLSKAQADYEKAKELLGEIVESQHSSPKEMKVLARVNLGLGNIKRFEAEDLLNAQDQKQAQKALRQAVQLYLAAAKSAQMFGQDVLLKATIYKELSQAHALLQNWREAEDYCNRALEALAGAQDPEAYVSYYAFTLDAKGNLHRKKAKYLIAQGHHQKALSEYEAAYKIAQKEIAILDGFIGESQDLVIAHINAGEYLSAIQKHRDTKVLKPMSAACQHWQIARDMAQRLGLPHWENEADSHLIRSCPD
jgi:tetratricopeptide (TPR) repeat protein